MREANRRWAAALSAAAVTAGLSVAMATPAAAVGGPCGQGGGSLGSSGLTGSLMGSLGAGSLGSATGSLANSLPWITGAPNGALPVLSGPTKALEMVTGPGSPNDTIDRFSVAGTDLGIMWDNGAGQVLMAFGDTVGDCGIDGDQWRSNVLFRSNDANLADGMRIDSSPLDTPGGNFSRQVIKGLLNLPPGTMPEFTVIPTGGVAVDGVQYVRWMSVRSWDVPGEWTTNYSGLAFSTDNGENWTTDPATVRLNREGVLDGLDLPGVPNLATSNKNWQMSAFVPGRGADSNYVYEFGTPSGRSGEARLARVPKADIRNLDAYEYRTGSGWSQDIADAVPVIRGNVSELSVQWNPYLGKYVGMYTDMGGLKIRQSSDLINWSGTQTLIGSTALPSLYGGFMHPWTNKNGTDKNLYFVLTTWDRYNVIYMKTDLSGMRVASTDTFDRPDPAITGEQRLEGFQTPEGFVEPDAVE
ncbi:DUF4185 domain-containing protein [Rhodococcus hoagii]|nr:DUF4185 domain-containing protein [Prescottella equi]NKR79999.1 DUF4185 domain-containing protein [Prescottella equi]NKS39161.1 DUF4185 domain-containing protein [Prescottella equi]NKZ63148.1 DUF4185 domain-containing protein [Prescottella equi]